MHVRRLLLALVVALGGSVVLSSPHLAAAPAGAAGLPEPVRADVLPAPQVGGSNQGDGVVWKQAISGNTAFAGGQFSTARPFGVAAGGPGEISAGNLIAFALDTGTLNTSFTPMFNAPVRDLAVTPDGTKLVVGGNFTQVDGQTRNHLAVFDLPALTLSTTVVPSVNSTVMAVAASNSTIWFGGIFSTVIGTNNVSVTRTDLAAVSATTGNVLPLNIPGINARVTSMAVKPDGTQLAFGGNFTSVRGSSDPGFGLYLANAVTGAQLPMAVNGIVRDGGPQSGITGMAADATSFYGTGYSFHGAGATGNHEGAFQASWSNGALVTMDDCHGDSYGVAPVGDVVYVASHHHYCGNSGGFPQTVPDWTLWHAAAWTKSPQGTNTADPYHYPDHPGTPRGALLNFFPQFTIGSATGQNQATWTVTGNSQYVLFGGEFPKVDGIQQQGIVRFGVRGQQGTNHVGPIIQSRVGPFFQQGGAFTPHVVSVQPGEVRVSSPALWDRDDLTLTYDLLRDGSPVASQTVDNYQWSGKQLFFKDTGLTQGSTPSYVVRVSDPDGNTVSSSAASTTVASSSTLDPYATAVLGDGATTFWRLDDSGSTVTDLAGPDDATAGSGVTPAAPGAIGNGSTDSASAFDGTANGVVTGGNFAQAPTTFSEEVWFQTTSTYGKIAGFGNGPTGSRSALYDRHLYLDNGILKFGVAPGGSRFVVRDAKPVNDGQWHQAVATLSSARGMVLYVDGVRVGAWADQKTGQAYSGYWHLGADSSWAGGSNYFTGSIDDFSVYPTALTDAQVRNHYVASGGTAGPDPAAPKASFSAAARGRKVSFRGAGTSAGGTIMSYAWNFGDGTRSAVQSLAHTYARNGSYTATLTVTDDKGNSASASRRITVVNARPTATFAASVRKKTFTFAARGGDADGRIVSYVWRFGDGRTARGASVRHTYGKAKKFTVSLTVTDNSGAKTTVTRKVKTKKR